mmetsp:Transcript_867/g.3202  ORF Transcript_867/g.3202 Transcript_867/m.3202 type:complete len:205 (+) Transcript_867:340-954(+)
MSRELRLCLALLGRLCLAHAFHLRNWRAGLADELGGPDELDGATHDAPNHRDDVDFEPLEADVDDDAQRIALNLFVLPVFFGLARLPRIAQRVDPTPEELLAELLVDTQEATPLRVRGGDPSLGPRSSSAAEVRGLQLRARSSGRARQRRQRKNADDALKHELDALQHELREALHEAALRCTLGGHRRSEVQEEPAHEAPEVFS